MTALVSVCKIIHLAVCLPARWLSGNSHKLSRYDWYVRSMGQMVDFLEKALELVQEDGMLILNENFMMGIFDKLISKLPPLAEYIQHMYESKKMSLTALPRQKGIPLYKLREELFFKSQRLIKAHQHWLLNLVNYVLHQF